MSKYRVSWTIEEWYSAPIEANSPSEALDIFAAGDYAYDSIYLYGTELQDSVEIEEI